MAFGVRYTTGFALSERGVGILPRSSGLGGICVSVRLVCVMIDVCNWGVSNEGYVLLGRFTNYETIFESDGVLGGI